ncbi:hypothetical protein HOLleu_33378 [Holothuria leucospilota]|uniref:Transmembrane protein n=1 Tax=Holothuria leucospilota TaxID=206669 RepID=A0A9Q0YSH4_HOLLE|nr:hypothetical protein HOLleu_33378 [Holothuria leucospilota]
MNKEVSTDHSSGLSKWRRRLVFVLSIGFLLLCVLVAFTGILWYLFCYFGKKDHTIRFLSAGLCYWPAMMSVPFFGLTAFARNNFTKRSDVQTDIAWPKVFNESVFARQLTYLKTSKMTPLPKIWVFLFFHGFAFSVSCLIAILYVVMYKSCQSWISYVWMSAEIIALFYFALFSYFLYLQRIILEEEGRHTLSFIISKEGNIEVCIAPVKKFFCNYMQLRKVLLPWLCVVMFSSTFGLTAFLTWTYENNMESLKSSSNNNTEITPTDPPFYLGKLCTYSCNESQILAEHTTHLVYSSVLLGKLIMPAVLAFLVIEGLDVKHVWDRFSLKLLLMLNTDNLEFWKCITEYSEKLHPNVTFDTLVGFVIPVLGLASGLLEGHHLKF